MADMKPANETGAVLLSRRQAPATALHTERVGAREFCDFRGFASDA
jgi:hypothetical protein